jgi:hypothetical protein
MQGVGKRGDQAYFDAGRGMTKAKPVRVKREARKGRSTVECITEYRVPGLGEVDADLVSPAGFQARFHQ